MRKKSLAIVSGTLAAILAIPLAGYAGQIGEKPIAGKTFAASKSIVVAGATKEQVYNKVLDWSKRYADSSREEPGSGLIVSKGEITYPSPTIDRIQYTFVFIVKNTIEGNKDTVTFEKVLLKSPTIYNSDNGQETAGTTAPITSVRDRIAAQKVLTRLTDNLEAYLLAKSDTACALTKCPECATLGSSAGDMQEHLKVHTHGNAPQQLMDHHTGHVHAPSK